MKTCAMEGAASRMEATNEAMAALFFWMSIMMRGGRTAVL